MSMQNHQSQNRKSGLAKPLEPHAISVDEIAGFAEVLDQAPSFRQTLSAVAVTQNETSDVRFHDGSDGDAGLRVHVTRIRPIRSRLCPLFCQKLPALGH